MSFLLSVIGIAVFLALLSRVCPYELLTTSSLAGPTDGKPTSHTDAHSNEGNTGGILEILPIQVPRKSFLSFYQRLENELFHIQLDSRPPRSFLNPTHNILTPVEPQITPSTSNRNDQQARVGLSHVVADEVFNGRPIDRYRRPLYHVDFSTRRVTPLLTSFRPGSQNNFSSLSGGVGSGSTAGLSTMYEYGKSYAFYRFANCSCPIEPYGIAKHADWSLLGGCLFGDLNTIPTTVFVQAPFLRLFVDQILPHFSKSWKFVLLIAGETNNGQGSDIGEQGVIDSETWTKKVLQNPQIIKVYAESHGATLVSPTVLASSNDGSGKEKGSRGKRAREKEREKEKEERLSLQGMLEATEVQEKVETLPIGAGAEEVLVTLGDMTRVERDSTSSWVDRAWNITMTSIENRPLAVLLSLSLLGSSAVGVGNRAVLTEVAGACRIAASSYCHIKERTTAADSEDPLLFTAKYPLILCPPVIGLDPTPCMWKVIAAGAIPIIKASPLDDVLSLFPAVIVNAWEDVLNNDGSGEKILREKVEELKGYQELNSEARAYVMKVWTDYSLIRGVCLILFSLSSFRCCILPFGWIVSR